MDLRGYRLLRSKHNEPVYLDSYPAPLTALKKDKKKDARDDHSIERRGPSKDCFHPDTDGRSDHTDVGNL